MQNKEYMDRLRAEWEKILGGRSTEVTDEERTELRRILAEQDARRENGQDVS